MEQPKNEKAPAILDFSGDILETVNKLESILCTTPWNRCLNIYDTSPSETKLLIELLREKSIVVGEVYYNPGEFTDEITNKAKSYLFYLAKRDVDYNLYTVARIFSKYEIDISLTEKIALYYPDIKAYVRCGDLSPEKLFELLQKDCCERVIIVNGAKPNENSAEEAYYSFEMRTSKSYILERLEKLQDEKMEAIYKVMEKSNIDNVFPDVKFPPFE